MATATAPKTSKFFRIATEGATTDGRTITREMIEQMARNYDPKKYGARINLEHVRGILPDGPFKAYGDVIALKAEKAGDGKLQLLAQLNPTDELVALTTQQRQKVYSSMEVAPDFAKSGEAYLVGLAVTDNPASLGTEMLQFSANAKVNPLASRKQEPDNLFSEAVPFDLELETDTVSTGKTTLSFSVQGDDGPTLMSRITSLLKGGSKEDSAPPQTIDLSHVNQAIEVLATSQKQVIDTFAGLSGVLSEAMKPVAEAQAQLRSDFDALVHKLSSTDVGAQRAPATGSKATHETDC